MKGIRFFLVLAVLTAVFAGCSNPAGGGSGGSVPGGNTPGGNTPGGNTDFISGTFSAYVSTSLSDEYAYELAFETEDSSGRAAVLTPKDGGNYSLIAYGVSDGKVKGVSEGKIKKGSGKLTLKPNDGNDPDITVTVSGDEMTEITGETRKGGNHTMPGNVKPYKQTEGTYGDFKYATNPGNTVTITKYTGKGGAVTVPAQINGKTVIGFGLYAFSTTDSGLTSVTLPDSITYIGSTAFYYCSNLTGINIDNITSIGSYAFHHCGLTNVDIPDSVTFIGNGAFSGCYLTSVTIGNGVTSIEYNTFSACPYLTSVTIGNSVTSIRELAFAYCANLTSVTIGNAVTYIGGEAFHYCTSLASVTIPTSVTVIGGTAFANCTSLTGVTFASPSNVTTIGMIAFDNCNVLTNITIPDSVTSIGQWALPTPWLNNQPDGLVYAGKVAYKYKGTMPANTSITILDGTKQIAYEAFSGCKNLVGITIPASVTEISIRAFYQCTGLTSFIIPDSETGIGTEVFAYCSGLTSVTIPASVTLIAYQAFAYCTRLTSVTFSTGSNITSENFYKSAFPEGSSGNGDTLRAAYLAASTKAGTYTRPSYGTWTKIN